MATTTATPLDTEAEAKAAKKKEPKEPFNERWIDKKGWVTAVPAAAGFSLHHHPDPDPVHGDADHLVYELASQLSQRDRLRNPQ